MNSLFLLIKDEFKGFVKSKIIIALWVGLPIVTILLHYLLEGIGESVFLVAGVFVASIGGLLAAVMLSSTMVNEITNNVYDLYLIRPVKRWHIIIAKYVAVMITLIIATLMSFAVGIIVDSIQGIVLSKFIIKLVFDGFAMAVAAMSIACAIGLFIGMLVKSVALAVILSIYLGQQLSLIIILPGSLLQTIDPLWFSIGVGIAATAVILVAEIFVFQKKQF